MPLFDITKHRMICSKGDFTNIYLIQQVNGQLVSTFKNVPQPVRGTEVYIKKLPRDILLQDIFEFASRCGDIFRIRLLMDFSGYNRGYCFVTYFDVNSARKAILTLNGDKIKVDCTVFVKISFDNNKLEMRGIPLGINREEIFKKMSEIIGNGLIGVITFKKHNNVTYTTKCVLKYDTHRHALEARKKIWPTVKIWRRNIEIDWAVPHEVLNQSKRLYFQNAPRDTTKLQLYDEITKYIEPVTMLNMFLQKGLGYLLFVNGSVAFDAFLKLRAQKICGEAVEFSFTKFYSSLGNEDKADKSSETTLSENMNETLSSDRRESLWDRCSSSIDEESIAARSSSSLTGSVSAGNSSIENIQQFSNLVLDASWDHLNSSATTEPFYLVPEQLSMSTAHTYPMVNAHQYSDVFLSASWDNLYPTVAAEPIQSVPEFHSQTESSAAHFIPVENVTEDSTNYITSQTENQPLWPVPTEQYSENVFPTANSFPVDNVTNGNAEFINNNCYPLVVVPNPVVTMSGPYNEASEIHHCVSHYFNFSHPTCRWIYTCTNEVVNPNFSYACNNMVRIMPTINHVQYDLTLVQVPRVPEYHF